jgi:hypothetical protein
VSQTRAPRTWKTGLSKALLLVAVLVAACALPAHAWAGGAGLIALLLAAAVALFGGLAGRLPRALLPPQDPNFDVNAALAGVGARLLVTAALALVVLVATPVPRLPFATFLVLAYLLLLVVEIREALTTAGVGGTATEHLPDGAPSR